MLGAIEKQYHPVLFEAARMLAKRDLPSMPEPVINDVATQLSNIALTTWMDVPTQAGAPAVQLIMLRMQGMSAYRNLVDRARKTGRIYPEDSDPRIHAPWALDANALVESINARSPATGGDSTKLLWIGAALVGAYVLFSSKKR